MAIKGGTRKRQDRPLRLDETESWGQRLRRAFYVSREAYDNQTYRAIAARISQVIPASDVGIQRLYKSAGVPSQARQRLLAWCFVTALGFDPMDFGLTSDNVPLAGYDLKRVRDLLRPSSTCLTVTAA